MAIQAVQMVINLGFYSQSTECLDCDGERMRCPWCCLTTGAVLY